MKIKIEQQITQLKYTKEKDLKEEKTEHRIFKIMNLC